MFWLRHTRPWSYRPINRWDSRLEQLKLPVDYTFSIWRMQKGIPFCIPFTNRDDEFYFFSLLKWLWRVYKKNLHYWEVVNKVILEEGVQLRLTNGETVYNKNLQVGMVNMSLLIEGLELGSTSGGSTNEPTSEGSTIKAD